MDITAQTMNLWIVGEVNPGDYTAWKFRGVFDDEGKAVGAARGCGNGLCFVTPVRLNEQIPPEVQHWPETYYPRPTEER